MSNASTLVQRRPNENKLNYGKIQKKMTVRFQRLTDKDRKTPRFIYRNYPRLRLLLSHRHEYYRRQLELVERMEEEGRILVIRPMKPMEVSRLEDDVQKLTALYEEGYQQAALVIDNFIQNNP